MVDYPEAGPAPCYIARGGRGRVRWECAVWANATLFHRTIEPMNRLLAILIFCAVPPLAALGRLTALALATLSRFGFQRLLAVFLVGWIIVPQLAGRGVFGILPR